MPRRFQFSLANLLLIVTCCALAIGWWSTTEWRPEAAHVSRRPPTDATIRRFPITIAASEVGDFAGGYSWHLSVNSAGQADLTIDNYRKGRFQRFSVSDEQLSQLRELLIFQDFFSLADEYGDVVPSGSTRIMTISVGDYIKTVRIHFLGNWRLAGIEKLREPARALTVWKLLRGWFEHPEAVDTRKYDQMVFDALKG